MNKLLLVTAGLLGAYLLMRRSQTGKLGYVYTGRTFDGYGYATQPRRFYGQFDQGGQINQMIRK